MGRASHWKRVYESKDDDQVSWFQPEPALSLSIIQRLLPRGGRVIDVGGGTSRLVDRLLDAGFEEVGVLDVSDPAIQRAKIRLGPRADRVRWIVADVTTLEHLDPCDLWHDRAAFHFLTDPDERHRYGDLARRTIVPAGHALVSTFAASGPPRCSGLDVCRYDAKSLADAFGADFLLVEAFNETHLTPAGAAQDFIYALLQRRP
jgi:SAM-dependent methyltransferase